MIARGSASQHAWSNSASLVYNLTTAERRDKVARLFGKAGRQDCRFAQNSHLRIRRMSTPTPSAVEGPKLVHTAQELRAGVRAARAAGRTILRFQPRPWVPAREPPPGRGSPPGRRLAEPTRLPSIGVRWPVKAHRRRRPFRQVTAAALPVPIWSMSFSRDGSPRVCGFPVRGRVIGSGVYRNSPLRKWFCDGRSLP